jgi:hypothetical protein
MAEHHQSSNEGQKMKMFNAQTGSKLRMALRSLVVVATAFGLELSADQVAAIQLVFEALLALLVKTRETE